MTWHPVMPEEDLWEGEIAAVEVAGTKVVVLSQLDDADTRLEGFALGVDDYWTKDFSLVEFCARIQRLLGLAPIPPVHPG